MKYLIKFNESSNLDSYKKRLDDIDNSKNKKDYNYYVGSVKTPGYALYHGTFKGFHTHEEVIEYIKKLEENNVRTIKIFSPEEYKEIEKIRNQGQ